MEDKKCDEHSKICQEVTDLKQTAKGINEKVGIKQMWAVVVLFVMISMAIVGWLYAGQVSVRAKLDDYQEKLTGEHGILIKMDKKLDRIDWSLSDHLKIPPSPDNGLRGKSGKK